jgi:hypothetical protein
VGLINNIIMNQRSGMDTLNSYRYINYPLVDFSKKTGTVQDQPRPYQFTRSLKGQEYDLVYRFSPRCGHMQ